MGQRRRADDRCPTLLLKTLSEQAQQGDAYAEYLSKAEASKRIDALRDRLKLGR